MGAGPRNYLPSGSGRRYPDPAFHDEFEVFAMAFAQAPAAPTGGHPVTVTVTDQRELSRWWGVPFFGNLARWVLAIPHFVVLWVLGIVASFWFFLGWIPILVNGRVPGIAVQLLTEYIQRGARVGGYVAFLMPGGYPPLERAHPLRSTSASNSRASRSTDCGASRSSASWFASLS